MQAQKVFEEALNAVKFLGWLKKFGPAQNIFRPVKGQGKGLFDSIESIFLCFLSLFLDVIMLTLFHFLTNTF